MLQGLQEAARELPRRLPRVSGATQSGRADQDRTLHQIYWPGDYSGREYQETLQEAPAGSADEDKEG